MEEKTYIFEGKTTNEAIEKGLKELKTTKNNVEIKVLENEDKKTFFSILAPKVVKVEMKLKEKAEVKNKEDAKEIEDVCTEIEKFIKDFVEKLPVENVEYIVKIENGIIKVDIPSKEASFLIGYRGETLNSLQTILSNIASNEGQTKVRVQLNISGYRQKREDDLKKLADRIAESVINRKKAVTLEPMNSYDRKIIHSRLQNNEKVTTHSIGVEPHRKVVVSLSK